jgi:hypothetical protein
MWRGGPWNIASDNAAERENGVLSGNRANFNHLPVVGWFVYAASRRSFEQNSSGEPSFCGVSCEFSLGALQRFVDKYRAGSYILSNVSYLCCSSKL